MLLTTLNYFKSELNEVLLTKNVEPEAKVDLGVGVHLQKNSETVVTIYDNQSCFELYHFAVDLDLAEKYFWLRF